MIAMCRIIYTRWYASSKNPGNLKEKTPGGKGGFLLLKLWSWFPWAQNQINSYISFSFSVFPSLCRSLCLTQLFSVFASLYPVLHIFSHKTLHVCEAQPRNVHSVLCCRHHSLVLDPSYLFPLFLFLNLPFFFALKRERNIGIERLTYEQSIISFTFFLLSFNIIASIAGERKRDHSGI